MVKAGQTNKTRKDKGRRRQKYPDCPVCGGASARIVYGLIPAPSPDEEGDIVLGGCEPRTPNWECKECAYRWPKDDTESAWLLDTL